MTAPITGPFTDFGYLDAAPGLTGVRPRIYQRSRSWYRQRSPFDVPLNFSYVMLSVKTLTHNKTQGCNQGISTWEERSVFNLPSGMGEDANLYNKVYSKFKSELGASAALGISIAEGKQAMDMMVKRLVQMANFTRHLAKGRLGEAAKALGINPRDKRVPKRPRREVFRDFSNLYLEFHFGWSPLVKDIYESAEVLSSPYRPHPIKVSSTTSWVVTNYVPAPVYDGETDTWRSKNTKENAKQTIKMQAEFAVTNPNLALNAQMGLINPADRKSVV